MNKADIGDFEVTRSVADWRVAAARIPTQQSVLCEGHASEDFEALGESDVLGKGCNNVRSSHLVQNVAGFAQEMRKGLTVFAVAHAPTRFLGVADEALQSRRTGSALDGSCLEPSQRGVARATPSNCPS